MSPERPPHLLCHPLFCSLCPPSSVLLHDTDLFTHPDGVDDADDEEDEAEDASEWILAALNLKLKAIL